MTTAPFSALIGEPLTAPMAPASIKLAKAPMNTFLTVRILLRRIAQIEQTTDESMGPGCDSSQTTGAGGLGKGRAVFTKELSEIIIIDQKTLSTAKRTLVE
jgi:hypothetical protein